ncbi:MAG: sulfite dehydrogenase [Gammaproteobacteria bacterium]|nr:MAG: sulfite dehydrogenase [Gammaproteobacteria bacterium]
MLDRRLFLRRGLQFGTAAFGAAMAGKIGAAEEQPWQPQPVESWQRRPGGPFSNYGQPSKYESEVVRWIASNPAVPTNGVSWTPLQDLEGIITPNGLHYERHHNGVPDIPPERHVLMLHGLVEQPQMFGIAQLKRYPMVSRICFIECGGNSNALWSSNPTQTPVGYFNGLVSCSEWTGVPLSTLLDEAGLKPEAKWLVAQAADAVSMTVSIPVEKALDDAILALYQNGERLRPENGYPLRLVLPGWEGVTNVKWLHRLQAAEEPVMSRNETARYTELLPDGKARQFTFVMDVRSLIINPSMGMELAGTGLYQISGLAWSGHGKVTRVEVSADGGESWAEAELQEPVLDKCFTRFRIPWRWDGSPAILQSRAWDSAGNVQPTREQQLAERGRWGYFHFSAIVSWEVDEEGFVSHVYA